MRRILALALALLACFVLALAGPAQAERKVALVIGNAAYQHEKPLRTPVNDANDMASSLKALGFEVILLTNAERRAMKAAVDTFWNALKRADMGLFFYAGHGFQYQGDNYLVPVNAKVALPIDIPEENVNVTTVLGRMEDASTKLNIIILDACRNNLFASSKRSIGRGLAQMAAPTGSLMAFAAAPGETADDGSGRNGLYTSHLLRYLRTPNLKVEDMLKRVRIGVTQESAEDIKRDPKRKGEKPQVPWENSSLTGDFYFVGGAQVASLSPASTPAYTPAPLPVVSAPPKPGSGSLDLSDIDADAAAQARAEAAARKDWAARLKAMQADFAKVEAMEKNDTYSAEHKAKAWERFAGAYADKNPYSDQDQALRAKAKAQQAHWTAERQKVEQAKAKAAAENTLNEAWTADQRGDTDEAIRLYTKALDAGGLSIGNQSVAFNNRGIAYKNKGQYDRAIQDYDQAIRLKPDFAEAFNNRGNAYDDKGQYDRAIQDYDQALKLKPNDAFAFGNRAFARKALGQIDLAKADAKRALELDPKVKVPSF